MLKNIAFSFLVANLIAAVVIVVLDVLGVNIQHAQAIAILAVTVYLTYFVIVSSEKQTGIMGVVLSVVCLILTITFLSILVSVVNSLTLSSVWNSFLDTFRAEVVALILAIAALVVTIVLPLKK